uniref:Uncharacterized protein n=1 Tax=uncultured organism TaxID=155900 RepID=D8VN89_9ZZZZ|nr:hypothetical protein [uncultured organism]
MGIWIKFVALAILGSDGNIACQLILVDAPALTGAGAIHVEFSGRAGKPDTMLLATDDIACELATLVTGDDEPGTDEGELLEPPPPPPHETRSIKLEITNNFFTLFSMVITS